MIESVSKNLFCVKCIITVFFFLVVLVARLSEHSLQIALVEVIDGNRQRREQVDARVDDHGAARHRDVGKR